MNTCFLTSTGLVVPLYALQRRLGKEHYAAFCKRLTIITPQKVGKPKIARMYSEIIIGGCTWLRVPRTCMIALRRLKFNVVVSLVAPQQLMNIAKMSVELYQNQQIVVDYLLSTVFTDARRLAGTAACILDFRAGQGKTYVAAAIIAALCQRTLWITPKRPLAAQAVRDCRNCFALGDVPLCEGAAAPLVTVGKFEKGASHDVTVMVINSALLQPKEFFAQYSLIVFDEVHAYCTDKRSEIFRKCCAPFVLGMTATSNSRTDGFDPVAHKELAFDGIIIADAIPGFEYDIADQFDCRAECIQYYGPPEYTQNLTHESTGRIFTHYMHNQFIGDPYRLRVAVTALIELYDWRGPADTFHNIYVFAEELAILRIGRDAFIAALTAAGRGDIAADIAVEDGGAISDSVSLFTGGLRDGECIDVCQRSRVLFSTYGYAGTGISVSKMTAIMFLTPRRANMLQILARILRRGSDMTVPRVVVDIVDSRTALRAQLGQRKAAYDYYGFSQTERKVRYDTL